MPVFSLEHRFQQGGLCDKLTSLLSVKCPQVQQSNLYNLQASPRRLLVNQRRPWARGNCWSGFSGANEGLSVSLAGRFFLPEPLRESLNFSVWSELSGLGLTWLALLINLAQSLYYFYFQKRRLGILLFAQQGKGTCLVPVTPLPPREEPRRNPCK